MSCTVFMSHERVRFSGDAEIVNVHSYRVWSRSEREARLRWFVHVRRKDDGYVGRRMLRMELPGKRKRGRPERRFMDAVRGHDSG